MELAIHQLCDEDQANPQEQPIRTQWMDEAPIVGQPISMGSDRVFEVAGVYTFEFMGDGPVTAVHVTFSQIPGSNLEVSEWGCWKWKDILPKETLFVQLEGLGLPDLGCGMDFTEESPKVGSRLQGGVPVGEGNKLRLVPTAWVVEGYDTYEPVGESPYTEVHLTWCKRVAMEGAIAA